MNDSWLFFNACGHPFGLHVATPTVQTERQAWNAFYWTERERRAAEDRGVTCRRVDYETYREEWAQLMRDGCDCKPAPEPNRPKNGVCPVCGVGQRLKKDGGVRQHRNPRARRSDGLTCVGSGYMPKGS